MSSPIYPHISHSHPSHAHSTHHNANTQAQHNNANADNPRMPGVVFHHLSRPIPSPPPNRKIFINQDDKLPNNNNNNNSSNNIRRVSAIGASPPPPREKNVHYQDSPNELRQRRFLRDNDNSYINPLKHELNTKEISFTDVVDIDKDDALEGYVAEDLVGRLIQSIPFRVLIVVVILFNSITIGIETDKAMSEHIGSALSILDTIFLTIFMVELLLKWYHGFFLFWKSGWNLFDFFIVAASIISPMLTTGSKVFYVLRGARTFRSLRSFSALPGLQVIVQTFVQSIPDVANILVLLFIVLFIFSVFGVTLFSDSVPLYFSTLPQSMFTLFIYLTQDGWGDVLISFIQAGSFWVPAIYSALFMVIGAFILCNAFVGIIVNNLQEVFAALNTSRKARYRKLTNEQFKNDPQRARPITHIESTSPNTWKQQAPLEFTDFSRLTVERFENYMMVLTAIEDNLAEFKRLKTTLEEVLLEVKALNEQQQGNESDEEEDKKDDPDQPPGDVLSGLIRQANEEAEQEKRQRTMAQESLLKTPRSKQS
eukprot:TRINITY_DN638_c0_g1_i2.p1 TRINITY_DN638_c0_g1~~TRINITY_DN638_c0_g1_i2.p1  ORF type:complete len:539 (-),score=111.62 TRINITY_DN638_c0_g1_i2:122-1738(-)